MTMTTMSIFTHRNFLTVAIILRGLMTRPAILDAKDERKKKELKDFLVAKLKNIFTNRY